METRDKITEKLNKTFSEITQKVEHLIDKMTDNTEGIYLGQGSRGDLVKSLQSELFKLGLLSEECISGVFGEMTKSALVKAIGEHSIKASHIKLLKNLKPFIDAGRMQDPFFVWAIVVARDQNVDAIEYKGAKYSVETLQKLE
ncbi:MAG: hypothetical protein NZ529_09460 [Cytophagaceae bacterium]|nr:hypothetical protein [Cytophagaceae bacterium]MDW8457012.1 hypothetical protein [Cytophagaceae bacterium]